MLAIAKTAANGRSACHTTVVGIGVDVSVGTVQTLSKIPGCKYFSVSSASEFEEAVASEFAYDVTPIAFNLDVALTDGRKCLAPPTHTHTAQHVCVYVCVFYWVCAPSAQCCAPGCTADYERSLSRFRLMFPVLSWIG